MNDPLSLIPAAEADLWEDELVIAEELAAHGDALAGYRSLDAAYAVAEALPPEIWKEELLKLYRAALVMFCETHGLSEPASFSRFRSPQWDAPPDAPQ